MQSARRQFQISQAVQALQPVTNEIAREVGPAEEIDIDRQSMSSMESQSRTASQIEAIECTSGAEVTVASIQPVGRTSRCQWELDSDMTANRG